MNLSPFFASMVPHKLPSPRSPASSPVDPHRAAALFIVNSGRKARNLPPLEDEPLDQPPLDRPPPPLDPVAFANFVILAGKRRRGEIE